MFFISYSNLTFDSSIAFLVSRRFWYFWASSWYCFLIIRFFSFAMNSFCASMSWLFWVFRTTLLFMEDIAGPCTVRQSASGSQQPPFNFPTLFDLHTLLYALLLVLGWLFFWAVGCKTYAFSASSFFISIGNVLDSFFGVVDNAPLFAACSSTYVLYAVVVVVFYYAWKGLLLVVCA